MVDTLKTFPWKTALLTGASSGIGKAMAQQLAAAQVNLVLVARNEKRMAKHAKSLTERYGVDVQVLAADLADIAQLELVEQRARCLTDPIDLLVNNAAFGTNGVFSELSVDEEQKEIFVNVVAPVRLAHAALNQMLSRNKGTILNISSMSALLPQPRMATYGATKAYLTSFSEALHEELRDTNISVTVSHPGFTKTEFQERAGMQDKVSSVSPLLWMTAEQVATKSLYAAKHGMVFYVPGRMFSLFGSLVSVLPRRLKRVLSRNMKQ